MTREVARAGGVAVSDDDLLLAVRLGPGAGLLQELLVRRLASARAAQEGLAVDAPALEEAVGQYFADAEAFEAAQIEAWLLARKATRAQVESWVRESLLLELLRERLAPDAAVERRFRASPHDYARVGVETLTFAEDGPAAEVALQLREGETAWDRAAALAGGMASEEFSRKEAPEEAAALLFTAAPGALVGPVETDDGSQAVYRVLWRRDAELTEDLQAEIREALFREELLKPLARAPLTYC